MESYRVSIEKFEGPLDLLLHLIQDAEIDICDIFVSEITSQYLAYMKELDALDMDRASEFLSMAATLLYIKSRQLLPKPPKEDASQVEEEDPEEQLVRRLRDYKAFKEAGEALEERFQQARNSMIRMPEDVILPPQRFDFDDVSADALYEAFLSMMSRAERLEEIHRLHRVRPDTYTVRGQLTKIRTLLRGSEKEVPFEELFGEQPQKMEVIVTFMALLEMISHGEIHLKQSAPFAPMTVIRKHLLDGDEDISYMDEETSEE